MLFALYEPDITGARNGNALISSCAARKAFSSVCMPTPRTLRMTPVRKSSATCDVIRIARLSQTKTRGDRP